MFVVFVKFPRSKVKSRDKRGVGNIGGGDQNAYYREQNHRTTLQVWSPRQHGKTDVPDMTSMFNGCANERKYENKTRQRCHENSP